MIHTSGGPRQAVTFGRTEKYHLAAQTADMSPTSSRTSGDAAVSDKKDASIYTTRREPYLYHITCHSPAKSHGWRNCLQGTYALNFLKVNMAAVQTKVVVLNLHSLVAALAIKVPMSTRMPSHAAY
mmetsp:Transcript_29414/g.73241  ORF Transcript_29414/g.73241 Transcript_29414/m.73241 type:complete len:126 (-) Transcript_29414:70-447(-)